MYIYIYVYKHIYIFTYLQVSDFYLASGPLNIGQLWGNSFTITLRDVCLDEGEEGNLLSSPGEFEYNDY
jgi:tRNA(Glu) U13 pseudouridine synthase TruD